MDEHIKWLHDGESDNCLSIVLLLSDPPLVKNISLGLVPKIRAIFSLESSSKILASLPAQCGLDGFANDKCATLVMDADATGNRGEVALWSK